ncbi:hypothetical protein, partial [Treponema saccharophilum]|uniref:hypothetical protein n=1 Tax=Treponema saccharophilum TaxID=165 RepID=UPI0038630880
RAFLVRARADAGRMQNQAEQLNPPFFAHAASFAEQNLKKGTFYEIYSHYHGKLCPCLALPFFVLEEKRIFRAGAPFAEG